MPKKRIFLDYASITPIDSKVRKVVEKTSLKFWANPSSIHTEGEMAKSALEEARIEVARIMHSKATEVVFTASGTESLNLAIFGVVEAYNDRNEIPHIITSTIEHPAVLEPIKHLQISGQIEVSFISPNEEGLINPESIKREIKSNTILVAIQHANNEIGVIQPIRKIALLIQEYREKNNSKYPYLLVDASQSFLYENVTLERLQADLLVVDGIKIYGPRGASVLVIKSMTKLSPLILGGGQESGKRSGTQNLPSIVGFVEALKIAVSKREKEVKRLNYLRDYFIKQILLNFPKSTLNGSQEYRLPNNANFCFPGQDSEFLVIKLDTLGVAVSSSSACANLSQENASYVIESLGKKGCASSSIRFTFGRESKKNDLDKVIYFLKNTIK